MILFGRVNGVPLYHFSQILINNRMKKKLILGVVMLFRIAVLPTYAQADPDRFFTVFEETFKDSFGDFTFDQWFDDFMYMDEHGNIKYPEGYSAWSHDETNHCILAKIGQKYVMGVSMTSPEIDLTDLCWFNINLSFEHSGFCPELYMKIYEGEEIIDCISPLTVNYNSDWSTVRFVNSGDIPLEKYAGKKIRIYIENANGSNWYVKNFRVTAKHVSGGESFCEVNSISEILSLPSGTPVKWYTANAVKLNDFGRMTFIRDETGAIEASNIIHGKFGARGSVYDRTTIQAFFVVENFIPRLKNCVHSDFLYDDENPGKRGNYKPTLLTSDDYWNHICDHVTMPIESPVYFRDLYDWLGYNLGWVNLYNNLEVSGIIYPAEDGTRQLIMEDDIDQVQVLYKDNQTNIYNHESLNKPAALRRHFEAGLWHTICSPFPVTNSRDWRLPNRQIAEFVSSSNGVLEFQTVDKVDAGTPFLIKFEEDTDVIYGTITLEQEDMAIVEGQDYNFVGTLNTAQPKDGSYYLTANNTIKPLSSGGTIKAFRAYFEPVTPNAVKARAVNIDGMTTAIEEIEGGEELFGQSGKAYNINGQYVSDDLNVLPKGVYVINGKKIIK